MAVEKTKPNIELVILLVAAGIIIGDLVVYLLVKRAAFFSLHQVVLFISTALSM